ncbi:MAG: hypothetical protein ACI84K_001953 [Pseudohongiellaceae bacterium]|jgi:hypothetical protein
MESKLVFYPVIAQIILTFIVYMRLPIAKNRVLKTFEIDLARRALHNDAWPDSVLKISNNVQNQFESPVLFYALCFMLWALNVVSIFALLVAWGYVVLRVIHVFVHTGSNEIPIRKKVFMASTVLLIVLCGCVIYGLLVAN